MSVNDIPYLIPYYLSALISLGLAIYAWQRRMVPGSKPFVVMALSQVLWTVGYTFELVSPSLQRKIFWDDVQFVASLIWPLAYFLFVWQFSGRQLHKSWLTVALLLVPVICFLLLLTVDGTYHLVRPESTLIPAEPFDILYYEFSTTTWLLGIYIYGLIGLGMYVLVRGFVHAHKLYRKQVGLVFIGTLFPIVGTLLTLAGVVFLAQRDTSPLTFMISNVIIAWALYRFRLFDIVPIARDYVVGHMSDIVFVLDAENRFVDINPAAEQVLGHRNGDVIGHQSNEILSEWAHLVPLLQGEQEKVVEIEVTFENESYYLAVKLTPLYDDQGILNGRLVVARDISDMKLAEQNLQKHAAQLEAANQELLALSEIKDEFVANVSHELRTPLANLKLYHDLQIK